MYRAFGEPVRPKGVPTGLTRGDRKPKHTAPPYERLARVSSSATASRKRERRNRHHLCGYVADEGRCGGIKRRH